jgi:hypothetical protein
VKHDFRVQTFKIWAFGRPKHRWEDNIKTNIEEIGCEDAISDLLSQDKENWRVMLKPVTNFGVP